MRARAASARHASSNGTTGPEWWAGLSTRARRKVGRPEPVSPKRSEGPKAQAMPPTRAGRRWGGAVIVGTARAEKGVGPRFFLGAARQNDMRAPLVRMTWGSARQNDNGGAARRNAMPVLFVTRSGARGLRRGPRHERPPGEGARRQLYLPRWH